MGHWLRRSNRLCEERKKGRACRRGSFPPKPLLASVLPRDSRTGWFLSASCCSSLSASPRLSEAKSWSLASALNSWTRREKGLSERAPRWESGSFSTGKRKWTFWGKKDPAAPPSSKATGDEKGHKRLPRPQRKCTCVLFCHTDM